ncbi:hypothetical protein CDAR_365601 [Caerostris darwini]|uniref:Uncharacterized protein n=1 Tax=Caerostris darwini TaxID=1538125 RepID=A0AAV4RHR2_9ARAC|nr:hypothetical protein CDAR_365601 [Caerostris darwini]
MFGLDKEAVLYQEAVYVTSPTSCKGDVTNHHQRFESPCSGGVARNRMARDYLQPFSPYGRYYLKVTAQLGSRHTLYDSYLSKVNAFQFYNNLLLSSHSLNCSHTLKGILERISGLAFCCVWCTTSLCTPEECLQVGHPFITCLGSSSCPCVVSLSCSISG